MSIHDDCILTQNSFDLSLLDGLPNETQTQRGVTTVHPPMIATTATILQSYIDKFLGKNETEDFSTDAIIQPIILLDSEEPHG